MVMINATSMRSRKAFHRRWYLKWVLKYERKLTRRSGQVVHDKQRVQQEQRNGAVKLHGLCKK